MIAEVMIRIPFGFHVSIVSWQPCKSKAPLGVFPANTLQKAVYYYWSTNIPSHNLLSQLVMFLSKKEIHTH